MVQIIGSRRPIVSRPTSAYLPFGPCSMRRTACAHRSTHTQRVHVTLRRRLSLGCRRVERRPAMRPTHTYLRARPSLAVAAVAWHRQSLHTGSPSVPYMRTPIRRPQAAIKPQDDVFGCGSLLIVHTGAPQDPTGAAPKITVPRPVPLQSLQPSYHSGAPSKAWNLPISSSCCAPPPCFSGTSSNQPSWRSCAPTSSPLCSGRASAFHDEVDSPRGTLCSDQLVEEEDRALSWCRRRARPS